MALAKDYASSRYLALRAVPFQPLSAGQRPSRLLSQSDQYQTRHRPSSATGQQPTLEATAPRSRKHPCVDPWPLIPPHARRPRTLAGSKAHRSFLLPPTIHGSSPTRERHESRITTPPERNDVRQHDHTPLHPSPSEASSLAEQDLCQALPISHIVFPA